MIIKTCIKENFDISTEIRDLYKKGLIKKDFICKPMPRIKKKIIQIPIFLTHELIPIQLNPLPVFCLLSTRGFLNHIRTTVFTGSYVFFSHSSHAWLYDQVG